jgi:hypothetical protein
MVEERRNPARERRRRSVRGSAWRGTHECAPSQPLRFHAAATAITRHASARESPVQPDYVHEVEAVFGRRIVRILRDDERCDAVAARYGDFPGRLTRRCTGRLHLRCASASGTKLHTTVRRQLGRTRFAYRRGRRRRRLSARSPPGNKSTSVRRGKMRRAISRMPSRSPLTIKNALVNTTLNRELSSSK